MLSDPRRQLFQMQLQLQREHRLAHKQLRFLSTASQQQRYVFHCLQQLDWLALF